VKKYILHPGWVTSKTDGQEHFITALDLAECYKVSITECLVLKDPSAIKGKIPDLIHLYPLYQQNYTEVLEGYLKARGETT
jgi:hypothetical protein